MRELMADLRAQAAPPTKAPEPPPATANTAVAKKASMGGAKTRRKK